MFLFLFFLQASFLIHRNNTYNLTPTIFLPSNLRMNNIILWFQTYKSEQRHEMFQAVSAFCGSCRASLSLADCFGILCSLFSETLLTDFFFFSPVVDSVLHRKNNSLWSLHLGNPFSVADSWKWNCVFQNETVEMLSVRNCVVTLMCSNFSIDFMCFN